MAPTSASTTSTAIACMRYRNAPAAIEWLCDVFGFTKNLVVDGPNGSVAHAQLSFGNGMIMLGSTQQETEFGKLKLCA